MLSNLTTVIEKQFELIGLTIDHGKTYLANLELGNSPASAIAKRAKIPRSTTYGLLRDLINKGLVSEVKEDTKSMFNPASPIKALNLFNQQLSNLQNATNEYSKSLNDLESIYNSHQSKIPKVRFYHGEDGLKNVYWDTFSANEVYWTCQGSIEVQSGLSDDPQYLKDYIEEFPFRNQIMKEILQDVPSVREYVSKFSSADHQCVIIPNNLNSKFGHVDKAIYGNKIAYISHDNLVGIIIEDTTLAQAEREQFETQWKYWTNQLKLGSVTN